MIDHDMACQTCGYALVAIDHDGHTGYEHPVSAASHPPRPVPAHHLETVHRGCHLCTIGQPLWEYRTDTIIAETVGGTRTVAQNYNTRWHVCHTCADLIDTGNQAALTRRSIAVMRWPADSLPAQILAGLHRAIILTHQPARTLITTGTWPPAPLNPANLPKIRDRLAELLRGPTRLPSTINQPDLIADGLDQARLYWIDPEFSDLVDTVHTDLPDTPITSRIVPAGAGLLTWAHPIDNRYQLAAASWTPHHGGWRIVGYRSLHPDLPDTDLAAVRHQIGWLIPVHVRDLPDNHTLNADDPLAGLATTWLIIGQQLTHDEPTTADPTVRRSYTRTGRTPPDIRIIRIKPVARRTTTANPTSGARARPSHRYWVSAHTRSQPYGPGRTLRRDVPIDPYLKGPDDAPIKASTTVRILGQHPH